MKTAQPAANAVKTVIRIGAYVAVLALAAMMFLTVLDVFLRFVFNRPILGAMEITEYLMVTLSFLAIAYCALEKSHVRVKLLVSRLKPGGQAVFGIVGHVLSLVLCVPLTLVYIPEAADVLRTGERSEVLGIPAFPFYVVVIIGCGLLSITVLMALINSIKRLTLK